MGTYKNNTTFVVNYSNIIWDASENFIKWNIPNYVESKNGANYYNGSSYFGNNLTYFDCNHLNCINGNMFRTFSYCSNLQTVVNLPDNVTNMYYTFTSCNNINNVVIPNTVTSMEHTFEGCQNLKSITLPNTIGAINGYGTFQNCANLTDVDLKPFSECSYIVSNCRNLVNVQFPDYTNSPSMYAHTFDNCIKLTNIVIPNSVFHCSSWGAANIYFDSTFMNCYNLQSATLQDLGGQEWCHLNHTFDNCQNLVNVNLGYNISYGYGNAVYTFINCRNLSSINIQSSIQNAVSTFYNCTNLQTIFINGYVQFLNSAFNGCSNLRDVYITNSVSQGTSIGYYINSFNGTNNVTTNVHIPFTWANNVNTPTYNAFFNLFGEGRNPAYNVVLVDINNE